jgi:hypothetical protein
MSYFMPPNGRLMSPLPRRDILAICAYLNRSPVRPVAVSDTESTSDAMLDRLAAAARMQ